MKATSRLRVLDDVEEPAAIAIPLKKRVVRMLALNLSPRDLSIALVMLKEFALRDPTVRASYEIHLHQWMKNYELLGTAGTVDGLDVEAIVDELHPEETDVFGFSMYIWSHHFMLAVAERVKERNPSAVLIFGGSQAGGYGPRMLSDHPFADYSIRGEAEYSFRALLLALLTGDVAGVPNLFYRENGEVRSTIPADPRDAKRASYLPTIEDLPFPFQSEEYRSYLDQLTYKVTAQFETERGCPLSCAFCSWGTRLPIRRRRQHDVEEGLTFLLNHPNVKAVYIVDANPFIKDEKGLWLTDYLLNKNKTKKPVYFELNPEYIRDERVIENLGKLAGDELAFGMQSTSDVTLKKIKRRFHRDVYEKNVTRLKEMNPDANIKFSLIVGLPGDNYDSFLGSLDFALSMIPADIYIHDLLILPGSEMYDDPEQFGIVIDRNPPHQLVYNETFPWEEYFQAKHVGYHAKLFQKDRWLRDRLVELVKELGGTFVDIYAALAEAAVESGLPTLQGKDVREVSSEEFDFRTDRFLSDPENVRRLHELFLEQRQHIRGSRQSNVVALQRKKSFERWVRGGL